MRIQHNITALNAHRNLTNNNSSVSKNLEKLSSGYRINRAGDDAAGLAISEKMRAQITGLETAQKNAEDGVSLVQTAEGALTEVHSMLNRMVELATQSANGTYSESNRQEMQKEIDALREEIDRISDTANFNGTNLFGGGAGGNQPVGPSISGTVGGVDVAATNTPASPASAEIAATDFGGLADGTSYDFVVSYKDATGAAQTKTISVTAGADDKATAAAFQTAFEGDADLSALFDVAIDATTGDVTITSTNDAASITGVAEDSATATITPTLNDAVPASTSYDLSGTFAAGDTITIGNETYTYDTNADGSDGKTFKDLTTLKAAVDKNGNYEIDITTPTNVTVTDKAAGAAAPAAAAGGKTTIALHVGESSSESNTINVEIDAMSSGTLGIDQIDITTVDGAKAAIDTVNTAIDTVSSIRSSLGALQNRLEHTINNLGVQTENITAAESRIRDVDMAKEMMAYTKNNILVQASQAMLAQANQVPQGVLQLLQ